MKNLATDMFQENPSALLGAMVLLGILAVMFMATVVFGVIAFSKRDTFFFSIGEAVRYGWNNMKLNYPFFAIVLFLRAISYIGAVVARLILTNPDEYWLRIGLSFADVLMGIYFAMLFMRFAIDTCEQHRSDVDSLIDPLRCYLSFFATQILYAIILVVGILLFIVPGVYWAIRFQFAPWLVVDKKLGPFEALQKSWDLTHGLGWNLFAYNITTFGIIIAGLLAFGVGLFVAIPLVYIATGFVYCLLTTEETSTAQQTMTVVQCQSCRSEVEISPADIEARQFTCPVCNTINILNQE